ncbi:OmpA family protein [Parasphingorhabdus halotolerans]|uniref:OmpA family protein n=1 Tax=Parasphingorhabdus halotolerans TaxID=2725558 RepID=A0A6H2DI27_9SPHN|nr:OmpA family protein [Parasphingorhabdus halotolerans]QJB68322.1 OmpA family protein [Parasphingorhabdus halotolerans]
MSVTSRSLKITVALGTFAILVPTGVSAQQQGPEAGREDIIVSGQQAEFDATMATEGPELKGIISARSAGRLQVTADDGTQAIVAINDTTKIKASGGFLGLNRNQLAADSLLNGLPVTVDTLQWNGELVASQIELKNKDLKTASMIRNGTAQGFAEQTAATEALRGRMGDIDKYNIKGTTNVNFDTGKWKLTPQAENELCAAANQAEAMDNALLLVVGYTDSVGSQEYNQTLSERRASRVVNHLQQACGWKPYRMLTPTGMAEADPLADNETPEGKAQNRRVAVNILVSKSVDGL